MRHVCRVSMILTDVVYVVMSIWHIQFVMNCITVENATIQDIFRVI